MKKVFWGLTLMVLTALGVLIVYPRLRELEFNRPKDAQNAEMRLVLAIQNINTISEELENSKNLTEEQRKTMLNNLNMAKHELESLKENLGDIITRYQNEIQKYLENLNNKFNSNEKEVDNGVLINPEDLCEDLSYTVHLDSYILGPAGWYNHESAAAGIIIELNGKPYILTAAHFTHQLYTYDATLYGRKRPVDIELLGYDLVEDLALFKFSDPDFVHTGRFAEFGKSSELKLGSPVMSVGSPGGMPFLPTFGRVSKLDLGYFSVWLEKSLNINQPQVIAHTAQIAMGNSGGPLICMRTGKVVGINLLLLYDSRPFSNPRYPNPPTTTIFLSVPSDDIIRVLPKLLKGGEVEHGLIAGLMVANSWEFPLREVETMGVRLSKIDGPIILQFGENEELGKLGLAVGDIILSVNGVPISTYQQFYREVLHLSPGDKTLIKVRREIPNGEEVEVKEIEVATPVVKFVLS